jgi:hypothetical protein
MSALLPPYSPQHLAHYDRLVDHGGERAFRLWETQVWHEQALRTQRQALEGARARHALISCALVSGLSVCASVTLGLLGHPGAAVMAASVIIGIKIKWKTNDHTTSN